MDPLGTSFSIPNSMSPRLPSLKLLKLHSVTEERGNLVFGEYPRDIPFEPKRFFIVYDVPGETVRGGHGHKRLERLLICVKGTCQVIVDDGYSRKQYTLDSPDTGIYVPPLLWVSLIGHSQECVLLVLASDVYDESDYLREYDEFLAFVAARNKSIGIS